MGKHKDLNPFLKKLNMEIKNIFLIILMVLVIFSSVFISGCTSPLETCKQKYDRCISGCEERGLGQEIICKLDCEGEYAKCHD